MTYEERMQYLSRVRPEKKDILLLKLARGEKIDLTKDSDLFFQINADRMSMDDWMKQTKFDHHIKDMKEFKKTLNDGGKTKEGKMRLIGEIPTDVFFQRPEFSPALPPHERAKNIKKFLNDNPVFKVSDKRI
jgi:hypothetical protein